MSSLRARVERLIGDGAFLGATGAFLSLVIYSAAQGYPTWVRWPERVLLDGVASGFGMLFEPAVLLVEHHGYLYLSTFAALLAWRRTRPIAAAALGAVLLITCARLTVFACFSIYVMNHRLGLLSVPLAFAIAACLTRWGRWPILSMVVLAGGLCVGVVLGLLFQHDYPVIVSPLHRFVPTALLALLGAWLIATRVTDAPSSAVGRFVRMWGLAAICVSCLMILAVFTVQLHPREPPIERLPIPANGAYDVYLAREPPELIWTDTEQIHVLTNPYGASHDDSYVLAGGTHKSPQRIWRSPSNGLYVEMVGGIGWWKFPPQGQPLSQTPVVEFRHAVLQDGSPCAFAEDPITRSVFVVSQWLSHYVVMDRDTGAVRATGRLSSAFQGVWHSTPDLPSRILYISSALGDGGLYELNLDSMAITRKASDLYMYETVLNPEEHILWGTRPISGEVIGVDTRTFEVLHRISAGFGTRDLQRDPGSGDLYTCSWFGDVFRVDVASLTAAKIARCGRICRNLFLDAQRDTLWAATDDGICRFPLATRKGDGSS
jgi:hypothetical protein